MESNGGFRSIMSIIEQANSETVTKVDFEIFFPEVGHDLGQDEEWCEIVIGATRRRIRFHDYRDIYDIPGLYERLFYDGLKCVSPRVIRTQLTQVLAERDTEPAKLR